MKKLLIAARPRGHASAGSSPAHADGDRGAWCAVGRRPPCARLRPPVLRGAGRDRGALHRAQADRRPAAYIGNDASGCLMVAGLGVTLPLIGRDRGVAAGSGRRRPVGPRARNRRCSGAFRGSAFSTAPPSAGDNRRRKPAGAGRSGGLPDRPGPRCNTPSRSPPAGRREPCWAHRGRGDQCAPRRGRGGGRRAAS